jgi:hypothetical protein
MRATDFAEIVKKTSSIVFNLALIAAQNVYNKLTQCTRLARLPD